MVSFKSWKDFYLFLEKYHNFSCLQCKHYSKKLDTNEKNSDFKYSHFFCPKTVSIVDFSFQVGCPQWEDHDGKTLKDYGESPVYNFSDELVDKLDTMKDITIEDIDAMVEE